MGLLVIDGRTQQSSPCLTPSSALGAAVAVFFKDFKLKADSFESVDDADLASIDAALQHLQGTCLQAADHIASAVQHELQALCEDTAAGPAVEGPHFMKELQAGSETPPSSVEGQERSGGQSSE